MRNRLTGLLFGLSLAQVAGAVGVGVAAAPAPTPSRSFGMDGAVWARVAAILGVPAARLTDALAQAHNQALDDAVKAGQLTQAQADWMKQHHQAMLQGGAGVGMMGGYGMMSGG